MVFIQFKNAPYRALKGYVGRGPAFFLSSYLAPPLPFPLRMYRTTTQREKRVRGCQTKEGESRVGSSQKRRQQIKCGSLPLLCIILYVTVSPCLRFLSFIYYLHRLLYLFSYQKVNIVVWVLSGNSWACSTQYSARMRQLLLGRSYSSKITD